MPTSARSRWSTALRRGVAEVIESGHVRAITGRFGPGPRDLGRRLTTEALDQAGY